MVRIFRDKQTGDFVVQTSCLDTDSFVGELAEALTESIQKSTDGEGELIALGILVNAMPIAFKLAGYKADTVQEQRSLICGNVSPAACEIVATSGK